MLHDGTKKANLSILGTIGLWVGLAVIINPYPTIDFLLISLYLLLVGQIILKEKIFLLFLLIRPTIDVWRDVSIFQIGNAVVNVNAAVSIVFFAWSLIMLTKHARHIPKIPLIFIFFLASILMAGSAYWSVDKMTTIIECLKFLNLVNLFVLGFVFIRTKKFTMRELVAVIFLSSVVPILFALVQLLFGTGLNTYDVRGRLFGTLGHPNVFAFLIMTLIILFAQISIIKPYQFWQKNIYLRDSLFVFFLTLLLLTYTRASFIGLAIFLFILGVAKYRKIILYMSVVIIGFYAIFYPVNSILKDQFNINLQKYTIISRLTARNDDADSIAWRQALLEETTPIILKRPLLGYGYGTFPIVWGNNQGLQHIADDSLQAHNDYLRLALEVGFIGLCIYLLLLSEITFVVSLRAFEDPLTYLHLLGWIITFIAISFSDNMLHHTPVIWLTFAYWGAILAEPIAGRKWSPNLLG